MGQVKDILCRSAVTGESNIMLSADGVGSFLDLGTQSVTQITSAGIGLANTKRQAELLKQQTKQQKMALEQEYRNAQLGLKALDKQMQSMSVQAQYNAVAAAKRNKVIIAVVGFLGVLTVTGIVGYSIYKKRQSA